MLHRQKKKITSPQMKLFYSISLATINTGYYGTLYFLDLQAIFDHVFGNKPQIITSQPNISNYIHNK